MDEEIARVVFRKWLRSKDSDQGILALFPDIDEGNYRCSSYEHFGQHGPADYTGCISVTTPALPEEYSALKKELESLGYNLKVIKRWTRRR